MNDIPCLDYVHNSIRDLMREPMENLRFELNGAVTRQNFRDNMLVKIGNLLSSKYRGISEFGVVCDDSNNTLKTIDERELICDVYCQLEDTLTVGFRASMGNDGYFFCLMPTSEMNDDVNFIKM